MKLIWNTVKTSLNPFLLLHIRSIQINCKTDPLYEETLPNPYKLVIGILLTRQYLFLFDE